MELRPNEERAPKTLDQGGEGRPRSLLRPRNPTTGRAADDRILSVREGESPAVPSWPSIVLYLGGLSFSSPSVLPTVAMHPQTPHQPPLQALLDLGSSSSEKTGNGMVHIQKLLPQVHELGGPDRLLLGHFQRGLWRRRRKTGTPNGQHAASRSIAPRSAVAPDPRGVLAFGLVPNEMSQGRAQQSAPDRPPHNCLDGFISAIFTSYRQVATAEPRTRHGQMPKSQWKRRDLGHEVGQPWLQRPSQNARDSARPAG